MLTAALILLGCFSATLADLPVQCHYEDVRGTWTFMEGARTGDNTLNCDDLGDTVYTKTFTFNYPNTVIDELGNTGTWVIVVDQGFEVNINSRSYFAYFYYDGEFPHYVSHCDKTMNGWAHDRSVRNWSCFKAQKNTQVLPRMTPRISTPIPEGMFKNDHKLIEQINSSQKKWWAKSYPEHEKYTMEEMFYRAGGKRFKKANYLPKAAPITQEQRTIMEALPESFDWRDVMGVNYVSPVRDQGFCGSCYSFASMGMLEARLRIATNNQRKDVFSPQDAMTCTVLGQGCGGGYNFLTAGRHTWEQGVVAEECNPYNQMDEPCDTDMTCPRTYISDYEFVGGYYGATNEANMMEALVENGPIGIALLMEYELLYYAGGIYHHTGISSNFDPLEPADHAVLLVGYGVDDVTGEKFWIVKNSWGASWGEEGYFRVTRGVDENAIESCAVQATVMP